MADIYLHDNGITSTELDAAKRLHELLQEGLSDYEGKVWLIPNVVVSTGTSRHDLDLLMIGYLDKYQLDMAQHKDILIHTFCTTIEVKTHGANDIYWEGDDLLANYSGMCHNITRQSYGQKFALISLLYEMPQTKNHPPFVSNLIWLTNIDQNVFGQYEKLTNSNIVTNDANMTDFFETIGRQFPLQDHGIVDSFREYSYEEIEEVAGLFCSKSK